VSGITYIWSGLVRQGQNIGRFSIDLVVGCQGRSGSQGGFWRFLGFIEFACSNFDKCRRFGGNQVELKGIRCVVRFMHVVYVTWTCRESPRFQEVSERAFC